MAFTLLKPENDASKKQQDSSTSHSRIDETTSRVNQSVSPLSPQASIQQQRHVNVLPSNTPPLCFSVPPPGLQAAYEYLQPPVQSQAYYQGYDFGGQPGNNGRGGHIQQSPLPQQIAFNHQPANGNNMPQPMQHGPQAGYDFGGQLGNNGRGGNIQQSPPPQQIASNPQPANGNNMPQPMQHGPQAHYTQPGPSALGPPRQQQPNNQFLYFQPGSNSMQTAAPMHYTQPGPSALGPPRQQQPNNQFLYFQPGSNSMQTAAPMYASPATVPVCQQNSYMQTPSYPPAGMIFNGNQWATQGVANTPSSPYRRANKRFSIIDTSTGRNVTEEILGSSAYSVDEHNRLASGFRSLDINSRSSHEAPPEATWAPPAATLAPPAAKKKIDKLPTISIEQYHRDEMLQCPICLEEFELAQEVKKLPCDHLYHPHCIRKWLKKHTTCPVCREDMKDTTTDDANFFDAYFLASLRDAGTRGLSPSSSSRSSSAGSDSD